MIYIKTTGQHLLYLDYVNSDILLIYSDKFSENYMGNVEIKK